MIPKVKLPFNVWKGQNGRSATVSFPRSVGG